jgi:hypothetical protein
MLMVLGYTIVIGFGLCLCLVGSCFPFGLFINSGSGFYWVYQIKLKNGAKKEMVDEIKLRELFDAEFEKQKEFIAGLFLMGERERLTIFKWFCLGFQAAYPPLLTFKTANPLTPEKREALWRQLKDVRFNGSIIVEPDSKLIFVYSWRSAQQRTMIILADSREEADRIFYLQFEVTDLPTFYVTQLFVDGGESTIVYNN